ncbi:VWA domain-containing protein [Tsukamurella sp. 8F]|uniref:MadC family VWA domain-containing protein n=1 Tax=unclassified Tsukamurella TaxID=2633480 RepID=UPI0023B915EC|nr:MULTISPECIES: VWA domain-containing protein [unclassified Tsukamurella]MDF0530827.1 VWA domain-containing protein [Tsukamurella sp. 8J]MDF0588228.1 VWA domain-containing protein [Tsukamurella sp. 8F]
MAGPEAPARAAAASVLDVVAAAFGSRLRAYGVATSPAEVIEVRRVLALLGARDRRRLHAALRATCVKYMHEGDGFERAYDEVFSGRAETVVAVDEPLRAGLTGGLPDDIGLGDGGDVARYADYNERAAEVGDYFDTPEAEKGFNPHKDDDDFSVTGSAEDLSVDTSSATGRRGVGYTLDVARAGTAEVGALSDGASLAAQGTLRWDDPSSILAWLDAYDPERVYADTGGDEELTQSQAERLAAALAAFVEALAAVGEPTSGPPGAVESRAHAELELAAHEVLRRMRGAPRERVRYHGHGRLDMRSTARAAQRTDGVPLRLGTRVSRPDRLRVLVLADVSLSVRPVTAFTLRLARAIRRRTARCEVYAFVDRPVHVTYALLAGAGDDALARVLADPQIDLEASSDYGRVFAELLDAPSGVDKRTSVLIVGDGRSGGLPDGAEHLAELRRRVHRMAWVTPEPERYWRQATCAMPAYSNICDGVVVARDADQLIERARDLGDALR